ALRQLRVGPPGKDLHRVGVEIGHKTVTSPLSLSLVCRSILPALTNDEGPRTNDYVGVPSTTVPSGTRLSRGTRANGPIVQLAPMLESRPMKLNGWITVSAPAVTPASIYTLTPLAMLTPLSRSCRWMRSCMTASTCACWSRE